MARLGARLPYRQAQDEIAKAKHVRVGEKTVRDTTMKNGVASEMAKQETVSELERLAPVPTAEPEKMLFSNDGAFVHLVSGEWREVKTLAIGEFDTRVNQRGEAEVRTSNISYFTRTYTARKFERFSLVETHRRGIENAKLVVAVNDGAEWIQRTIDYHVPTAIRVLDFPHAQEYIADAGKAFFGEDAAGFMTWFRQASHELKLDGPKPLLARLHDLHQRAEGKDKSQTVIAESIAYLNKRTAMLDYPTFRASHYPIGSGSVESANKVVMQSRMKQAGMRWQNKSIDPMLALRCLLCNDRWDEGWQEIIEYRQHQRRLARQQRAQLKRERFLASATQDDIIVTSKDTPVSMPNSPKPSTQLVPSAQPYRPPANHPWRRPFLN